MEQFELVVDRVSKGFDGKQLWTSWSFRVPSGAMTAVTGPSGAGKTTLLNCPGQLEDFDFGECFLPGLFERSPSSKNRCHLFRDVFGFLFQNDGLVETWLVTRNLEIAQRFGGGTRMQKQERRATALARVGLAGCDKETIYTLSGGEQQCVALARLMLKQPRVILSMSPPRPSTEATVSSSWTSCVSRPTRVP